MAAWTGMVPSLELLEPSHKHTGETEDGVTEEGLGLWRQPYLHVSSLLCSTGSCSSIVRDTFWGLGSLKKVLKCKPNVLKSPYRPES